MYNILLIDDEEKICEFIVACLENNGFKISVAHNGENGLNDYKKNNYDLIILDRMLPDINGEQICEIIRKESQVPIIMLTAKIQEEDRLDGFKSGCDDYLCKPFNINELVYRIKSVLKRVNTFQEVIKFGDDFELSKTSPEVKINGHLVNLTNTEYKILLALSLYPNKVYTREELLEKSADEYYEKIDRVIDSHIKNLRHKIESKLTGKKIIQTVYGIGYKFGL